jgi:hypothetical protein
MRSSLGGERIDHVPDRGNKLRSGNAAVQPQVQRNLVVARAPCVQGGPGRRDFSEPAFDCGVNVLVGVFEFEFVCVELPLDTAQATLDRRQPALGKKARRGKATRVSEAAGDVERVQLEVDLQRRRESLQLGKERSAEAPSPKLSEGFSLSPSGRGSG